jgi:deazaflavin-dependent oxidoreductase (nitroreductase family)
MNNDFDEQFLYLTTIGRKTGLLREIWFVELNNRLYVLAEHGYKAQWLQNVIATPSVTIRLAGRSWNATGRVLEPPNRRVVFGGPRSSPHEIRLGRWSARRVSVGQGVGERIVSHALVRREQEDERSDGNCRTAGRCSQICAS